jgi:hypothetical protein
LLLLLCLRLRLLILTINLLLLLLLSLCYVYFYFYFYFTSTYTSTATATDVAAGAGTAGTALSYGAKNLGTAGTTSASPSLLSQLSGGLQSANTWANQNPVSANIAMQTASGLLTPPPPPEMAPPPGLARGQQFQMEQPTQYAMGSPRISLI